MHQDALPLPKLQVAGENTINCRGVSVPGRCGIVGNDQSSGSSKNGDGIGESGRGSSNSDSGNVSDSAVRAQSLGHSKDYPILLDMDDYTPEFSLKHTCLA